MLVHQRGDPKQSTGVGAFRPVPTTNVQEKFLPSNDVKEFKDLDLVGARLSWRINGLGDPSRAFRALALIAFVAGLRLKVKDRFCSKGSGLCYRDQVAVVLQHAFPLPIFPIETCRMSLTDNLTPYLLIGPRRNFGALSLSYSSFYFCFN